MLRQAVAAPEEVDGRPERDGRRVVDGDGQPGKRAVTGHGDPVHGVGRRVGGGQPAEQEGQATAEASAGGVLQGSAQASPLLRNEMEERTDAPCGGLGGPARSPGRTFRGGRAGLIGLRIQHDEHTDGRHEHACDGDGGPTPAAMTMLRYAHCAPTPATAATARVAVTEKASRTTPDRGETSCTMPSGRSEMQIPGLVQYGE